MVLLTLVPTLELRASIPYGMLATGEPAAAVFVVCVVANGLLALPVYWIAHAGHRLIDRVPSLHRVWERFVDKGQRKIAPYVDRWGTLGLALFIGVPLPGSGVYTGVVGAYVLGLRKRQVFLASSLGVLIAGTAVTLIVLSGSEALDFFIKR
jgi:uncharacterized membrane protein